MAKTGIEVKFEFSEGMKRMGELFHRFHLDGLAKFSLSLTTLEMELDGGERRRDPLGVPHLIECTPGEHEIHVTQRGTGIAAVERALMGLSLKVNVQPDTITTVRYLEGMGGSISLEVIGTRPG